MAHLKRRQVEAIPKGLHWFCPREKDDDSGFYFDEDLLITTGELAQDASVTKRVENAYKRRDLLKDALTIFAFDGPDAEGPQRTLEEGLAEQLSKCDICVREYHRLRDALRQHLLKFVPPCHA